MDTKHCIATKILSLVIFTLIGLESMVACRVSDYYKQHKSTKRINNFTSSFNENVKFSPEFFLHHKYLEQYMNIETSEHNIKTKTSRNQNNTIDNYEILQFKKHNDIDGTSVHTELGNDYTILNLTTSVIKRSPECSIEGAYEKARVLKTMKSDQITSGLISFLEINAPKHRKKVRRCIIKNVPSNTEAFQAELPLKNVDESLVVHSARIGKRPAIDKNFEGKYIAKINENDMNALQDHNYESIDKEFDKKLIKIFSNEISEKRPVFGEIVQDDTLSMTDNDYTSKILSIETPSTSEGDHSRSSLDHDSRTVIKYFASTERSKSPVFYKYEKVPFVHENFGDNNYAVIHRNTIGITIGTLPSDPQDRVENAPIVATTESLVSITGVDLEDRSDNYDYSFKDPKNHIDPTFVDYVTYSGEKILTEERQNKEKIVYKCYVCGTNCTTAIPLAETCISNSSCGEEPRFEDMRACVFNGTLNVTYDDNYRVFGNWRPGCVKRYVDLNTIYTERSCLKKYNVRRGKPIYYNGTSLPSLRLSELEYFMENETNGCISAPFALKTPFGRYSLFSKYHVCICSDYHYCNTAAQFKFPVNLFILLVSLLFLCDTYNEKSYTIEKLCNSV